MGNLDKYLTSQEVSYDELQVARFVPCKFNSVVEFLFHAYTIINGSGPLGVDELIAIEQDSTEYLATGTLPSYGRQYVDTY